jgi:hypothetical protein
MSLLRKSGIIYPHYTNNIDFLYRGGDTRTQVTLLLSLSLSTTSTRFSPPFSPVPFQTSSFLLYSLTQFSPSSYQPRTFLFFFYFTFFLLSSFLVGKDAIAYIIPPFLFFQHSFSHSLLPILIIAILSIPYAIS